MAILKVGHFYTLKEDSIKSGSSLVSNLTNVMKGKPFKCLKACYLYDDKSIYPSGRIEVAFEGQTIFLVGRSYWEIAVETASEFFKEILTIKQEELDV